MSDNRLALAGTSAAGADGTGLVWMAQTGSTAPTDGTTALAAAWKNMGGIADTGVTIKSSTSTKTVKFYGSVAIQRTLVTDQAYTIDVTFAETNARVQEVYWRQALNSISPTAVTGAFSVTAGIYTRQLYACVVDMIDGTNHLRFYFPSVEVTGQADLKITNAESVAWGVTLSAYPNTSGIAMQAYEAIPVLG